LSCALSEQHELNEVHPKKPLRIAQQSTGQNDKTWPIVVCPASAGGRGCSQSSYQAARDACSSSSSGGAGVVSERLRQEVTADVILGQAQVGLLHTLNPSQINSLLSPVMYDCGPFYCGKPLSFGGREGFGGCCMRVCLPHFGK
jgi:hypothetical protein